MRICRRRCPLYGAHSVTDYRNVSSSTRNGFSGMDPSVAPSPCSLHWNCVAPSKAQVPQYLTVQLVLERAHHLHHACTHRLGPPTHTYGARLLSYFILSEIPMWLGSFYIGKGAWGREILVPVGAAQ